MAQKIFVSYNFNDRAVTQTVKQMIDSWQDSIDGLLVFVENDVSYNGPSAINWEINHVMAGCDAALFILGHRAQNSPWVEQEAAYAIANNISILMTKLPGESLGIPAILNRDHYSKLSWDANELTTCINAVGVN